MYNLLFCFLPLHRKDTYLTINVMDIIFGLVFSGLFAANNILPITVQTNRTIDLVLDIALLIMAIIALFLYFNKRHYHTTTHKAYMIVRLFATILKFISYISVMLVVLTENTNHHNKNDHAKYIIYLILYGILCFLNLYWSYLLMKIIN